MSISPQSVARGLERLKWLKYCTERTNYIQFMAQHCQKYALNQKKAYNITRIVPSLVRIFLIFFNLHTRL